MDQLDLSATSWGAILAGAVTATAVTLIVVAFGVGAGLAVISPWSGEGISATTASWAAGLFLVATAMIASTIGGYITGRLRQAWDVVHEDERFFRDTAHGLVTWALATVLTATVLGAALTHIVAGASAGSIPAAGVGAAQMAGSPGDVYVDRLLRREGQTEAPPSSQSPDSSSARAELLRIIGPAMVKGGDVPAPDRSYAARIVAGRAGISQADAEQRVGQVVSQAKDAADKARRAATKFSLWIAISLLAGALAGCLAAVEGGKLRNSKWYAEERSRPTVRTARS